LLDWDQHGRPVPSITAGDDEYRALLDVLERYPGKTLQVILGMFISSQTRRSLTENSCRKRLTSALRATSPGSFFL